MPASFQKVVTIATKSNNLQLVKCETNKTNKKSDASFNIYTNA